MEAVTHQSIQAYIIPNNSFYLILLFVVSFVYLL
jgi:hypothetical protein